MPVSYSTGNFINVSSDTTLDANAENVLVDATAGIVTITFPDASLFAGRPLRVKKMDATANPVMVVPASTQFIDNALARALVLRGDSYNVLSDGANWYSIGSGPNLIRRLAIVDIPLTAAGSGVLFTVPTGLANGLLVSEVLLEGIQIMTGTLKASTLKAGTSANAYGELFGSGGVVFSTTIATSLISVGGVPSILNNLLSTLNNSPVRRFPAGTVLQWNVSGALPLSTGAVRAHLSGILD